MVKTPAKTCKAKLWNILDIMAIPSVRQRTDCSCDIPIIRTFIYALDWLILPLLQKSSGGADKKGFSVSMTLYGIGYCI